MIADKTLLLQSYYKK